MICHVFASEVSRRLYIDKNGNKDDVTCLVVGSKPCGMSFESVTMHCGVTPEVASWLVSAVFVCFTDVPECISPRRTGDYCLFCKVPIWSDDSVCKDDRGTFHPRCFKNHELTEELVPLRAMQVGIAEILGSKTSISVALEWIKHWKKNSESE